MKITGLSGKEYSFAEKATLGLFYRVSKKYGIPLAKLSEDPTSALFELLFELCNNSDKPKIDEFLEDIPLLAVEELSKVVEGSLKKDPGFGG